MRVTVTGATGLIGRRLVAALRGRGDEVTVLSRRPAAARRMLGVEAFAWSPERKPAPAAGDRRAPARVRPPRATTGRRVALTAVIGELAAFLVDICLY
jgi:nucleoside-diphosphate-sugar epimerase